MSFVIQYLIFIWRGPNPEPAVIMFQPTPIFDIFGTIIDSQQIIIVVAAIVMPRSTLQRREEEGRLRSGQTVVVIDRAPPMPVSPRSWPACWRSATATGWTGCASRCRAIPPTTR